MHLVCGMVNMQKNGDTALSRGAVMSGGTVLIHKKVNIRANTQKS